MRKIVIFATIVLPLFIFTLFPASARADIQLKVAVVNPSTTEEQTTPVRFNLPKGMGPEDVLDAQDMEVGYDFEKGSYYVYKMVTLKPSEKKVLEVSLRDIWAIPEEEINFLKDHTLALEKKLKNTKHYGVGYTLAGKITKKLKEVFESEKKPTAGMSERINLYYENLGIMDEVKEDIGMLENLVIDIGGIVENRVQIPETLAISVAEKEADYKEPVELTVKVVNPSKTKKQVASVKHALPFEVTPRHVINAGGLDVGYDFSREGFYVYKSEVMLKPGEEKIFIIKMKDIWRVPEVEIEALDSHTNNLMLLLEETEHYDQGKALADKIEENLDEINETQALEAAVAKHIAYFRENTKLLEEAEEYLGQLEKIVTRAGVAAGVTIAQAERVEGGGAEVQRPRGYEGISYVAKTIFKGKSPTVATTWKIIFGILIFVAIVGASFYGLWFAQNQAKKRKAKDEETK